MKFNQVHWSEINENGNEENVENTVMIHKESLKKSRNRGGKNVSVSKKGIDSKNVMCEKCSKMFDSNYKLVIHANTVHGIRNIKCPNCDFCAKTQRNLQNHVLNFHERPFRLGCL